MSEEHRRMVQLCQCEPYRSMRFEVAWEAVRVVVKGSDALGFWRD